MTRFHTWRFRPLLWAGLLTLGAMMPGLARHAAAVCVGDCNGDGRVSIAEAQACVNRGANLSGPACAAADQNGDNQVEPTEVGLCIQSFLDSTTCPMVFTPVPTATNTQPPTATATNTPPPPPTSTSTPPSTNTPVSTNTPPPPPTSTFTPAESPTPSATPTISNHTCTLAAGSDINIYSAAFPVPLGFATTGSAISIGGAGAVAVCDVVNFTPINIIGIGYVCIQPGSGCAQGTRYCGPGAAGSGPALGIDVESDGNIGACTSNAACSTLCDAACPSKFGAGFAQLNSSCTGYCTTGAQMVCTTDAQCGAADQGSCNGPDNPAANANKCQCSCIKTAAFGGSDPGDLQCNLGADLKVEMAPPCNGTDVLINVGKACIPVTTQEAKGKIVNANFATGATVPGAAPGPDANDRQGGAVACDTFDSGTTTGLAGVGAVNFFGSTIGDLTVGLKAVCQ
jgi:hypothetical protein